ncbi:TPA: MazG nucleotide pyrophosphohydrolase domain-containing protein [Vibrio harveyi]
MSLPIDSIRKYQKQALVTAEYASHEYPLLLLAEEAGEVLGKLNKYARKNKVSTYIASIDARLARHPKQIELRDAIEKELGDVAWAWVVSCHEVGLDPADVLAKNIAKLRDRQKRGVIDGSGDDR